MSDMNFDFLSNVELQEVEKPEKKSRASVPKLPEGWRIRIFSGGKMYPSQQLADQLVLEYQKRTPDADGKLSPVEGNGFDIFRSKNWPMFPTNAPQEVIFICAVPKAASKVDVFGHCTYEKDGTPKASVMSQGGGSFGKELLTMLEEVYGIKLEKGQYLDLEMDLKHRIQHPSGIYYLPKTVSRGEKKGEITFERRDNVNIYPLIPLQVTGEVETAPVAEAAAPTEEAAVPENVPGSDVQSAGPGNEPPNEPVEPVRSEAPASVIEAAEPAAEAPAPAQPAPIPQPAAPVPTPPVEKAMVPPAAAAPVPTVPDVPEIPNEVPTTPPPAPAAQAPVPDDPRDRGAMPPGVKDKSADLITPVPQGFQDTHEEPDVEQEAPVAQATPTPPPPPDFPNLD